MKKFAMGIFVAVFCSMTAHAFVEEATFRSTEELPANSGIEGLWDIGTARLTCPNGYVVGKRFCWDYMQKVYTSCGVFCVKQPNPPKGDHTPEVP